MFEIPIQINETDAISRTNSALRLSFPVAQNALKNTEHLCLIDENNTQIPAHFEAFAFWPNQSLKWVAVFFQLSIDSSSSKNLKVLQVPNSSSLMNINNTNFSVINNSNVITINNGELSFNLNKSILGIFKHSDKLQNDLTTDNKSIVLTTDHGCYFPKITEITTISANPFEIKIAIKGDWHGENILHSSHFEATYSFYRNSSLVKFAFTLHNSNPMVHHKGKWDLGNENSLLFKSLNYHLEYNKVEELRYKVNSRTAWQSLISGNFTLYQASSAGNNWDSKNHVNHLGKVALPFKGFKLIISESETITADRASPIWLIKEKNANTAYKLEKFWQNFPKSLQTTQNSLDIGVFPLAHLDGFELQPGEKKTHTILIDYKGNTDHIEDHSKSLAVAVCKHYIAKSLVIPLFSSPKNESVMQSILAEGLTSNNNFFVKREVIDEFGWRNFGDIFADHETLEYQGEDELISHYNNQYDPLYGFIIQYLHTKDRRWWQLAEDLVQHIKDIDIYHTTEDRSEYNNGLFWHTDHYLPVETASHRTYSRLQKSNVYMDHAGGGGPGSNHCYTSGLLLHYQLTGEQSSKQAVEQLTGWITDIFEGNGTFGEMLLALKNRNRADLKNILTQKYPLDRGNGNYVNALIDAFEVSGKQSYLDKASLVIKNTISANDDIDSLNLLDIEETWFYTVFLQSTYKYLLIKEQNQQFDRSFYYSKQAFIHYCHWMMDNEAPYLNFAAQLEYPNHTWAAQDIRKANILYMASYFESDERLKLNFKHKADEFYGYVVSTLKAEPTRTYTRILTILMQNFAVKSYVDKHQCCAPLLEPRIQKNSQSSQLIQFFLNIKATFYTTSISKEIHWLKSLSARVNLLLSRLGH